MPFHFPYSVKLLTASIFFAGSNLQGIFIFSLASYKPLEYNDYSYPVWGQVIGWWMAFSSILCIPGYMAVKFVTTKGTFQEVLFFVLLADVICFVYYRFCKNFPICHHVVHLVAVLEVWLTMWWVLYNRQGMDSSISCMCQANSLLSNTNNSFQRYKLVLQLNN